MDDMAASSAPSSPLSLSRLSLSGRSPIDSLESLPIEVILIIFDQLACESHLDFAVTSRFIYNCAGPVLKQHRDAHRQFATTSDLDPHTVPKLLQSAIRGSIEAWHVRDIELWHDRQAWHEWRPIVRHRDPGQHPVIFDHAAPPTGEAYNSAGRVGFVAMMNRMLHMPRSYMRTIHEQLISGQDTPYKVLLIALCPRLRSLKVVRGYYHERRFDTFMDLLVACLRGCGEAEGKPWPPGFASLEQVSIGVATDTSWDMPQARIPGDARDVPLSCEPIILSMMHLPSLNSLYISHPGLPADHFYNTERYSDFLESGLYRSSPVEHIFLDGDPDVVNLDFWYTIFQAPHSLKSLTLRSDNEWWDNVVDLLKIPCGRQPDLQSLLLHGTLTSDDCAVYLPDDISLASMDNLRHLSIAASDLVTAAYYDANGERKSIDENWDDDQNWCLYTIAAALPRSLEVLIIIEQEWDERALEMSKACYMHIIRTKRCPKLHTLCIASPDAPELSKEEETRWGTFVDELNDFGRKHGVEVRISDEETPRQHLLDLPTYPELQDLTTQELCEKRPTDVEWEVDPFWGQRQIFRRRDPDDERTP